MVYLKIVLCEFVALLAPLVTIFYRDGWFNTPDDPLSPHGQYEQKMRRIYDRFGERVNDWWWLGVRNRAYGLRYALKPRHFKDLDTYEDCDVSKSDLRRCQLVTVDGYKERIVQLKWVHIIVGYRLTPIFNEVTKNRMGAGIPFRKINMDARPIFSIRSGIAD